MEQEKMVTGQKAEGKEETAQEQNREVEKRMGVGREKDMGAGKGAGTIKQSGLHKRHGRGVSVPPSPDMSLTLMNLKVLLPFRIFAEKTGVSRIVAETREGSFGLLPHRLDCVAALAPGILIYEDEAEGEVYVAVDEGVLIKTGPDVLVSVRNAIAGTDLRQLRETVEREFLNLDKREQSVRSVLAKMESGFIRRLAEFHHE
jgi:F-type H+-transporting ATPase subunit epsilon